MEVALRGKWLTEQECQESFAAAMLRPRFLRISRTSLSGFGGDV